jgi:hypothetical protein
MRKGDRENGKNRKKYGVFSTFGVKFSVVRKRKEKSNRPDVLRVEYHLGSEKNFHWTLLYQEYKSEAKKHKLLVLL